MFVCVGMFSDSNCNANWRICGVIVQEYVDLTGWSL